jgi:hypothetical protein
VTATAAARPPRLNAETALPAAAAAIAIATVTIGLTLSSVRFRRLGEPVAPFLMRWGPHVGPLAAAAVVTIAAALTVTPRLVARLASTTAFAAATYLLALALGLAVSVARTGFHGLWAIFDTGPRGSYEAHNEYLPGLPALAHGISSYVRHFPALLPSLPVHVTGNPPGPLVALHVLGIGTPQALAALCIGLGALTAPLAYDLGRVLGGEQRGRVAGALTAFSPATLLFGVTSVDYAFAALGTAAACLLVRPGGRAQLAGAGLAAVGSFFSWLLLAVPAWAVLTMGFRDGPRAALKLAALGTALTIAFTAALNVTLGYDPIATLRATGVVYHVGIAASRPYAYWVFGSPVAWALMLGPAIAWFATRAATRREPAAAALAITLLAASLLPFTKGETERIWLPFVPLACTAAAAALPQRALRPILISLLAQALAVQLLFDTVW